jgi:hypothetical protein
LAAYCAELDRDAGQASEEADRSDELNEPFAVDGGLAEGGFNFDFGMDLQVIGWGFWSAVQ